MIGSLSIMPPPEWRQMPGWGLGVLGILGLAVIGFAVWALLTIHPLLGIAVLIGAPTGLLVLLDMAAVGMGKVKDDRAWLAFLEDMQQASIEVNRAEHQEHMEKISRAMNTAVKISTLDSAEKIKAANHEH